jgi:hypothetical protein
MSIFRRIKETIDDFRAYGQGQEFGEAWKEQGGEDIDEEALHRFHVNNGLETGNWIAFNRGVRSVLGSSSEEEDE